MNTKKLLALVMAALMIIMGLCACSSSDDGSSSSYINTESEHNHDHGNGNTNGGGDKNNTSSNANAGLQRPDKPNKTPEEIKVEKLPELSEQGVTVSKQLLADLEKNSPKVLSFFKVKNTTYASTSYVAFETLDKNLNSFKTIKDKTTIQNLKDALEYQTWTAKKFTANTAPNIVIYFDDKLHLNIEGEVDGVYWMSLNASYGKVYYVVPENVYNNTMTFCYELEK